MKTILSIFIVYAVIMLLLMLAGCVTGGPVVEKTIRQFDSVGNIYSEVIVKGKNKDFNFAGWQKRSHSLIYSGTEQGDPFNVDFNSKTEGDARDVPDTAITNFSQLLGIVATSIDWGQVLNSMYAVKATKAAQPRTPSTLETLAPLLTSPHTTP